MIVTDDAVANRDPGFAVDQHDPTTPFSCTVVLEQAILVAPESSLAAPNQTSATASEGVMGNRDIAIRQKPPKLYG